MNDFSDQGEQSDRARADAGRQQEIRKIDGPALRCRGERAMEPPREDVTGTDIVVCRHDEVGKQRLRGRLSPKAGKFRDDPVGA